MPPVRFTDHAAWRTAERHGCSVSLDHLEQEIAWAVGAGWWTRQPDDSLMVTIRSGERFIVTDEHVTGLVVLTALGW